MPVLFTLARNYSASEELFEKSIRETAGDDKGVLFFPKNSCTSHDSRIREYSFCEAIKVDVAESEVKHKTKSVFKQEESAFKHGVFTLHTI
jgi:hypothetical protein